MQTPPFHKKNCILLISDKEYLKYLRPLVCSILKVVDLSNIDILCHLINVEKSELELEFPSIIFSTENIILSEQKIRPTRYKEMPLLVGQPISDKHAYCNNKRYELIPQLLTLDYINILYMDVDQNVRKDIGELFDIVDKNDITIHRYNYDAFLRPIAWRHFMTYCNGIIGIHNNDVTKKFFKELWEETVKNGIYEIGDQMDFVSLIKKNRSDIKLGQIPQTFKDDTFNQNSHIWTGDGFKKFCPEFANTL